MTAVCMKAKAAAFLQEALDYDLIVREHLTTPFNARIVEASIRRSNYRNRDVANF